MSQAMGSRAAALWRLAAMKSTFLLRGRPPLVPVRERRVAASSWNLIGPSKLRAGTVTPSPLLPPLWPSFNPLPECLPCGSCGGCSLRYEYREAVFVLSKPKSRDT